MGELVSNAWDADPERVDISFPEGPIAPMSEVVVRDYGIGM
ncbi:MAG: ATP-binding protein, partial [Gemmatimonadales bacterium]